MDKGSREKLIEAAIPMFALNGFAAVTTRELAKAANVNISAISYHFGSKEGLYEAVLKNQFGLIGEKIKDTNLEHLEPTQRVRKLVEILVNSHKSSFYLRRLMNIEFNNPTPYFQSIVKSNLAQFYKFFQSTLDEGIAKGQFKKSIHSTYAAFALVGMINFYFLADSVMNELAPPSTQRDMEYVDEVFNIYFNGLLMK